MLLHISVEYQHITHVDHHPRFGNWPSEIAAHLPLRFGGCVHESKGHANELTLAVRVWNTVLCLSSGWTGICKNAFVKSNVE